MSSVNPIPIGARTFALDQRISANGSYTLPQYAFIPHPSLQQLSSGSVDGPMAPMISASFTAPPSLQRAYPVPDQTAYGIRSMHIKASP